MASLKTLQLKIMNGPLEGFWHNVNDQVIIQRSDVQDSNIMSIPYDSFLDDNHLSIYKDNNEWFIINQKQYTGICFTQNPDNNEVPVELEYNQKQRIKSRQFILIGTTLVKVLIDDDVENHINDPMQNRECQSLHEIFDHSFPKKSENDTHQIRTSQSLHEIFNNVFSENSKTFKLGYCNVYNLVEAILQKLYKSKILSGEELFVQCFNSSQSFDKLIPWLKETTNFKNNYSIKSNNNVVSPGIIELFQRIHLIFEEKSSKVIDIYEILSAVSQEQNSLIAELILKTNFKKQIDLYKSHESVHFWKKHFIDIEDLLLKHNDKLFKALGEKKINDIINTTDLSKHLDELRLLLLSILSNYFEKDKNQDRI